MTVTNHLLMTGIMKSGTTFVRTALSQTVGAQIFNIGNPGVSIHQQILPAKLAEFMALPRGITGQHIPATEFNLRLLEVSGVKKILVQIRDPRDGIISWWRHLDTRLARGSDWLAGTYYAIGLMSRNYFEFSSDDRLRDLVQHSYPIFQSWISAWAAAIETDRRFEIHVLRYEDFVRDPPSAIRQALDFFGYDIEPVLPNVTEGPIDTGLRTQTMFRRGQVGSHRSEAPADVVDALNRGMDRSLARTFGWG